MIVTLTKETLQVQIKRSKRVLATTLPGQSLPSNLTNLGKTYSAPRVYVGPWFVPETAVAVWGVHRHRGILTVPRLSQTREPTVDRQCSVVLRTEGGDTLRSHLFRCRDGRPVFRSCALAGVVCAGLLQLFETRAHA